MDKLFFDKVVVGGSLTAILFAYKKNLPVIIDVPHLPFQLDECPSHWDLSFIGFSNKIRHRKSQVWDRLLFIMAMSGLVIFPNNMRTCRVEGEKIVIDFDGASFWKYYVLQLYFLIYHRKKLINYIDEASLNL